MTANLLYCLKFNTITRDERVIKFMRINTRTQHAMTLNNINLADDDGTIIIMSLLYDDDWWLLGG